MRVVCGSDSGILRVVGVEASRVLGAHGHAAGGLAIDCAVFLPGSNEQQVVLAYSDGTVQTVDLSKVPSSVRARTRTESAKKGPQKEGDDENETEPDVVQCAPIGDAVHLPAAQAAMDAASQRPVALLAPGESGDRLVCITADGRIVSRQTAGVEQTWTNVADTQQRGVLAGAAALTSNAVAIGGNEVEVQLWDLETQRCAWRAKNVKDSAIKLRVPVRNNAVSFRPDNEAILYSATELGVLRTYDRRAQRRPVSQTTIDEWPLRAMAVSSDSCHLAVATNHARLAQLDVRKQATVCGAFGALPACQMALAYHADCEGARRLCAVGLDRFVRVFDVDTCQLAAPALYVRSRLRSVLFSSEPPLKGSKSAENDKSDGEGGDKKRKVDAWEEEDEQLWRAIPRVRGTLPEDGEDDEEEEDEDEGDDDEDQQVPAEKSKKRRRKRRRR